MVIDPRQLPPIGAGRPFVDIVNELSPPGIEAVFPRCGASYAELTIPRRQTASGREDVLFGDLRVRLDLLILGGSSSGWRTGAAAGQGLDPGP